MPTKRELLEEKTVEDLKQMARDKELSGYSKLNKDGLIDIMDENYKKAEIESWPQLEDEILEEAEPEEELKGPSEEKALGPERIEKSSTPQVEEEVLEVEQTKPPEKIKRTTPIGMPNVNDNIPEPETEKSKITEHLTIAIVIAIILISIIAVFLI